MKETKAISTLFLVLLLLCSAIIGGVISYLWVISSYYNMPENSTALIIENANFSVTDFSYFNLTVLNPSNSASDINITAFRLTVTGTNETHNVTTTEYPGSLPYVLQKGVRQTFKCIDDWSSIAGETVRFDVLPDNVSTVSNAYTLPTVALKLLPVFDPSQTVNYFNLTVENGVGSPNLTISEIDVSGGSLNNVTPSLPRSLPNNESVTFVCNQNWEKLGGTKVTITVRTAEGYDTSYTTDLLPGATLRVSDVKFDFSDTAYFNLTISNSGSSTADPTLTSINLTRGNETSSLFTIPPLNLTGGIFLGRNQSLTLKCFWNWNQIRGENIMINVYTKQNFTVPTQLVITPPQTVWNVTDVKFDLDDLNRFIVNVTNTPCSLSSITIAKIQLNGTDTTLDRPSAVLTNGTQIMLNCTINWANFTGQNANVTVFTADGANISTILVVPSTQLKILGDAPTYGDFYDSTLNITAPYLNVTISNSANSNFPVTISKIVLEAGNITQDLAPDILYPRATSKIYTVNTNQTVTFVCYSDYTKYIAPTITTIILTVYTAENIQASITWHR